jgi:hypothetical protein
MGGFRATSIGLESAPEDGAQFLPGGKSIGKPGL